MTPVEIARCICQSVESVMQSPSGFALPLTPVQRAITRIVDGTPLAELSTDPDVIECLGGPEAVRTLPSRSPTELVLLAGVRTAKSILAGSAALVATQTLDLSDMGPGEVPRVPIVSLTEDNAKATFEHVSGAISRSPILRSLLVKDPSDMTLLVHCPRGKQAEIKICCLNAAGGSIVSRWLLGCVFDEAPRCPADGAKSLKDARSNVRGRLRDGGHIMTIGSPWGPTGVVADLVEAHYGRPSEQIVVVRATGPKMNPKWWTLERQRALAITDPEAYKTDVLAQYRTPEFNLFADVEIDSVSKHVEYIEREEGHHYIAVMDPATRVNAWTLVVLTCLGEGKLSVVRWKQWKGTAVARLNTIMVLREIATILRAYDLDQVYTDQWSSDALADSAEQIGLTVVERRTTQEHKVELFDKLHLLVAGGRIDLPRDRLVRTDMLNVRKVISKSGSTMSIVLVKTEDGRHADYAAVLGLAMGELIPDPDVKDPYEDTWTPGERDDVSSLEQELFG